MFGEKLNQMFSALLDLANKTVFNANFMIATFPNPEKRKTALIGYDRFLSMIWDVDQTEKQKLKTLNGIFARLNKCDKDTLDVSLRRGIKFRFYRR